MTLGRWSAQFLTRLLDIVDSSSFERIFVQRELTPIPAYPLVERLLTLRHDKVIFDFDDAIYLNGVSQRFLPVLFKLLGGSSKADNIVSWSNRIIVGNRYLRDYAEKHNQDVTVIPTCVDTERLYDRPKLYCSNRRDARPVIGWSGTSGGLKYLDAILPALRRIAQKWQFVLRIISDSMGPLNISQVGPDLSIEFVRWRAENEVRDIREFDVGIMPLPNDEFTRGKCGFKALQYMACALPVVVSPVGVNCEIVSHGENGLVARDVDEWERCLIALLDRPDLRKQLGQAAQETVESRYSVRRNYPALLRCLRD
jgi:glycosyltransferase involved in cell wall biosynthesis